MKKIGVTWVGLPPLYGRIQMKVSNCRDCVVRHRLSYFNKDLLRYIWGICPSTWHHRLFIYYEGSGTRCSVTRSYFSGELLDRPLESSRWCHHRAAAARAGERRAIHFPAELQIHPREKSHYPPLVEHLPLWSRAEERQSEARGTHSLIKTSFLLDLYSRRSFALQFAH